MFESAEREPVVDDTTYERAVPRLREALLAAQAKVLKRATFPVVVLISGVEAAGKGDSLQVIHEWMDPRQVRATAFDDPDAVEREHPEMWRFWRALPRAGTTSVFMGGWYREAIYGRVYGGKKRAELAQRIDSIQRFERLLTDEGVVLLKLWLHLSKKRQKETLRHLESSKRTAWRVKPSDWRNHEYYGKFRAVAGEILEATNDPASPWVVVAGNDANHRRLAVGQALLSAMNRRLAAPKSPRARALAPLPQIAEDHRLRDLDMKVSLDDHEYDRRLARAQGEIAAASRRAASAKKPVVLLFEGSDAAGKGGAIRRITEALDARHYRVNAIAAPDETERGFPYLWRFWTKIPRDGEVGIFDRSWYGRTLVERVEGFASEKAWMRAYGEINDFEKALTVHGGIVLKFWLQVTKAEQLRRFQAREDEGYKRYKITAEDWRNRSKWGAYQRAARDTFARTSTKHAPWTIVAANDKHYARVTVLETIAARLREAVGSDD